MELQANQLASHCKQNRQADRPAVRTAMEHVSQAAVRHEVRDKQLLLLLVEVGDDGEEVGVGKPPQPPHVLREVLPPDAVHLLEPLHHQGRAVQEGRLVRRAEGAAAQHLGGRAEQVLQPEPRPPLLDEHQLPVLVAPPAAAAALPRRRGRHRAAVLVALPPRANER